ncbi:TRAP transporter small permease [Paracoccus zhejiangensis]|nr:TRAP transporter small permease [Paracoccus zhejiangensis]
MRIFNRLEGVFLIALFTLALSALTAQLLSRYLLPVQFPWTEELARLTFTWIVFFGAAYAMRTGGLIAVTMLVDALPDRPRAAIAIAMHLSGAVFFAVVAWTGTTVAMKVANLPTIAMGVSSTWEYAAVPAASALMLVRSLAAIRSIWRDGLPRRGVETMI